VLGQLVLHSGTVFGGAWLTGAPLAAATLVLLRRSGARYVRHPGTLHWYVDGEIGRNLYRDMLWLPRR